MSEPILWTQPRAKGSLTTEIGLYDVVLTVLQMTSERNEHSCPEMISRISPEHVKLTKNQIMDSEKYGTGRNLEKIILFFPFDGGSFKRTMGMYGGCFFIQCLRTFLTSLCTCLITSLSSKL